MEKDEVTWEKIYALTGDLLRSDYVRNGYPTPNKYEFWDAFKSREFTEELYPFIWQQAVRYMERDSDIKLIVAKTHCLVWNRAFTFASSNEQIIQKAMTDIELVKINIGAVNGPLKTVFLEFIGITDRTDILKPLIALLQEGKLDNISEGAKKILWWLLFVEGMNHEQFDFIIQKGLRPPEVI